jgi:hypothetical protein
MCVGHRTTSSAIRYKTFMTFRVQTLSRNMKRNRAAEHRLGHYLLQEYVILKLLHKS